MKVTLLWTAIGPQATVNGIPWTVEATKQAQADWMALKCRCNDCAICLIHSGIEQSRPEQSRERYGRAL